MVIVKGNVNNMRENKIFSGFVLSAVATIALVTLFGNNLLLFAGAITLVDTMILKGLTEI